MSEERDFKGIWIPKEVWLDTRLSALDKVILMEIDSLDQGDRGCYATNNYIADFCQCGVTKVSTAISKLIKLGYLEVSNFDGRLRILKSRLSKSERQTYRKCEADSQKVKASNIDSNIDRSINNNTSRGRFTPPTVDEVRSYCRERGNSVDPETFCDFYASKGWMVGKSRMKDWKAAVRTWERGRNDKPKQQGSVHYDVDEIDLDFIVG